MSEKRKIDDKELNEIAGAGELTADESQLKSTITDPGGSANQDPDTNSQPGDNQNFTD